MTRSIPPGRHAAARWGHCALLVWLAGCASVLEAPRVEDDAQVIYLIDHGRHPSLVLPDGKGGAARYAYGDWRWFAEGETSFMAGAGALLWPTHAALGRQRLVSWPSIQTLRREVAEGFVNVYRLPVPTASAHRLAGRLDNIYFAGQAQAVDNPLFSLTFVPHPQPYWCLNNSNVVTARWLKALGIRVRGAALVSRWKVSLNH